MLKLPVHLIVDVCIFSVLMPSYDATRKKKLLRVTPLIMLSVE